MHLRVVSEELVTYKITRGLGRVSEGVSGGVQMVQMENVYKIDITDPFLDL